MISLALTPALAKSGDRLGKNSAVTAEAAAEGPAESRPPALLRAAEAGEGRRRLRPRPRLGRSSAAGRSASQAADERVQQIAWGECKAPVTTGDDDEFGETHRKS